MIYRYFSILLASLLLLTGLQVPSFVDQYEKRVDAHLVEVTENLRGFQEIADKYHDGSIEELIRKHEASTDTTFRLEAEPISRMYQRYRQFSAEKASLDAGLASQIRHIVLYGDDELIQEAMDTYTWTITLDEDSGLSAAVLLITGLLASDLLKAGVSAGVRRRRQRLERSSRTG